MIYGLTSLPGYSCVLVTKSMYHGAQRHVFVGEFVELDTALIRPVCCQEKNVSRDTKQN